MNLYMRVCVMYDFFLLYDCHVLYICCNADSVVDFIVINSAVVVVVAFFRDVLLSIS